MITPHLTHGHTSRLRAWAHEVPVPKTRFGDNLLIGPSSTVDLSLSVLPRRDHYFRAGIPSPVTNHVIIPLWVLRGTLSPIRYAAYIPRTATRYIRTSASILPFLQLPRELRDQIYNHALSIPDRRSDRALRIERRNLKHFRPSAAALLLVLHHEYFLLNRQIAQEALEALLKNHTIFLSCGPFILKSLFDAIEKYEPGKQWLTWLRAIELDWVTFPDLRMYPPDRTQGKDEWWFEAAGEAYDNQEVDVDYIRGAAYDNHYDEHDHTGGYYDDNFYDPSDAALYPSYQHQAPALNPNAAANDISTLFDHNPFQDAEETYHPATTSIAEDLTTKLDLLVEMEVAPLFSYLSTATFPSLARITLPLYFISRESFFYRRASRPGYTLPMKVRYWVHVAFHAFQLLHAGTLSEVRVKYMPWDIWASMDSCDDLHRMVERGVWFNDPETDGEGGEREHEGEAFRCVWAMLMEQGLCTGQGDTRMGLAARIRLVKWDGEMDSYRVGDELEVVFKKDAPDAPAV